MTNEKDEARYAALPLDKIEMLNEPLTTDEGFLNEACMSELAAAIKNMPETHERLAGDPEWSIPRCTSLLDILGNLASFAVQQMSTKWPKDLDRIVEYTRACLLRHEDMQKIECDDGDVFYYFEWSLCDVNRVLHEILDDLPEFVALNDADAHGRDFVDLSALLRNVSGAIKRERRHSRAFDIAFEREHPGPWEGDEH